jgi:hypothetical protein
MRILISYEEAYRVYADALERALGGLRPEAEVAVCRLAEIDDQLESFDPNLVVSSRPNTVDPGGRAAWYRLSPKPDEPSEACLGRKRARTQPAPGGIIVVHRRRRGACSQWAQSGRLLAPSGCDLAPNIAILG